MRFILMRVEFTDYNKEKVMRFPRSTGSDIAAEPTFGRPIRLYQNRDRAFNWYLHMDYLFILSSTES